MHLNDSRNSQTTRFDSSRTPPTDCPLLLLLLLLLVQTLGSQSILKDGNSTAALTIMSGSALSMLPLDTIVGIEFLDEDVLADLGHAIDLRRDNRKVDMQKLTIIYHAADDTNEATLRVRYSMPLDKWTSSYRMLIDTSSGPGEVTPEGESVSVTLEGHAIVENMQHEDWNEIKLTVAAGAPAVIKETDDDDNSHRRGGQSGEKGSFSLTVKMSGGGRTMSVRCTQSSSVYDVKTKISEQQSIPCGKAICYMNAPSQDSLDSLLPRVQSCQCRLGERSC